MEQLRHDNHRQMIAREAFMAKKNNHGELYNQMLNAKTSILLRINDKEIKQEIKKLNNEFLSLVEEIHKEFECAAFDQSEEKIEILIGKSRELLKYEWDRARDGERGYRVAKNVALMTVVLSVAFLLIVAVAKISPATSETSVTQKPVPLVGALKKEEQSVNKEHNNQLESPAPQAETRGKPAAP